MSSAGRAANSNGCVARPKGRETSLIGFAAQIQRSSIIGSCAMETAEHREPCESRGSCTDLRAPGGAIPPGDSPFTSLGAMQRYVRSRGQSGLEINGLIRSRMTHRYKSAADFAVMHNGPDGVVG
jgi:hypothetical protein